MINFIATILGVLVIFFVLFSDKIPNKVWRVFMFGASIFLEYLSIILFNGFNMYMILAIISLIQMVLIITWMFPRYD